MRALKTVTEKLRKPASELINGLAALEFFLLDHLFGFVRDAFGPVGSLVQYPLGIRVVVLPNGLNAMIPAENDGILELFGKLVDGFLAVRLSRGEDRDLTVVNLDDLKKRVEYGVVRIIPDGRADEYEIIVSRVVLEREYAGSAVEFDLKPAADLVYAETSDLADPHDLGYVCADLFGDRVAYGLGVSVNSGI